MKHQNQNNRIQNEQEISMEMMRYEQIPTVDGENEIKIDWKSN